ncbi:ATP-binding cassette domain-containing protein, partial [Pseudomonas aeruginosa]
MTLLTVQQLTIRDEWTDTTLVDDINFQVERGETLGIIGESGSGKSITCKALVGLNPSRLKVTGDVHFDGHNLLALSERQLRQYRGQAIAMVMQQGARAFD